MQPVPETREVRRTVRVAVALVVGQVLLCAIIGWVTFSYSQQRAHQGSAAVGQIAVPTPPIAAWPSGPAPSPIPAPAPSTRSTRTHSPRPAGPMPPASTELPAIEAATDALTMPAWPPTAAPTPTSGGPQATQVPPPASAVEKPVPSASVSAPPTEVAEEPVVPGASCDRLGALGRTADGRDVRCLPDRLGRLRWKIV